jgi:hypothetical protein
MTEIKQCCGYNDTGKDYWDRCELEGTRAVRAYRGGGTVGGWHELYVEYILWFCDEHYTCPVHGPQSWEDNGWTVEY